MQIFTVRGLATLLMAMLLCSAAFAGDRHELRVSGTWYLSLDAEPSGFPPEENLPGIAAFHPDGTFVLVDGGDFGGLPFGTRDTMQLGAWRSRGNRIEAVALFLQADAMTGDVQRWVRVELTLRPEGRDQLSGLVTTLALACDEPATFPVFGCPDPIESSGQFEPFGPPNVDVALRRLPVRSRVAE